MSISFSLSRAGVLVTARRQRLAVRVFMSDGRGMRRGRTCHGASTIAVRAETRGQASAAGRRLGSAFPTRSGIGPNVAGATTRVRAARPLASRAKAAAGPHPAAASRRLPPRPSRACAPSRVPARDSITAVGLTRFTGSAPEAAHCRKPSSRSVSYS